MDRWSEWVGDVAVVHGVPVSCSLRANDPFKWLQGLQRFKESADYLNRWRPGQLAAASDTSISLWDVHLCNCNNCSWWRARLLRLWMRNRFDCDVAGCLWQSSPFITQRSARSPISMPVAGAEYEIYESLLILRHSEIKNLPIWKAELDVRDALWWQDQATTRTMPSCQFSLWNSFSFPSLWFWLAFIFSDGRSCRVFVARPNIRSRLSASTGAENIPGFYRDQSTQRLLIVDCKWPEKWCRFTPHSIDSDLPHLNFHPYVKMNFFHTHFRLLRPSWLKWDSKFCIFWPCAFDSVWFNSNFYAHAKMQTFLTDFQLLRQSPSKWDQKCCILPPYAIDCNSLDSNFCAYVKIKHFPTHFQLFRQSSL